MEKNQLPIFSVSDFLVALNQTLEYAYPSVGVMGEVSGYKVNQGKWVFFDLKDGASSVSCFMSIYQLRIPIEDGMKVIVQAQAKVTQWGKFSLTVQQIRPSGEGSLKKSFELLRKKLDDEGLFNPDRKRSLPYLPRHIGVISSTQAAGYADFIKLINERWGGLQVDVAHVQVQGDAAPDQMIRAITYFNGLEALPEVLVIIRGGGSADDLSAFNDEPLVRAIAASRIPTLVGVGHETDETLADMVADVRAATPSNAAQIVVPDKREIIQSARHHLSRIIARLAVNLDTLSHETKLMLARVVDTVERKHQELSQQLSRLHGVLGAYNPASVLARGYAIIHGEVRVGNEIVIEKLDQQIRAEVTDVRQK